MTTQAQKHTPGPWTIPDWRQLGRIDVVAGEVKVAAVYLQPDPITIKGWPTEEANARLIAAAPALLEALKEAADCIGELTSCPIGLGEGFNSSIDVWLVNETGNEGWQGLAGRIRTALAQATKETP